MSAHRRSPGSPTSGKAPYGLKCVGPHGDRRYAPDPFTRRIGKWVVKWKLVGKSYDDLYWSLIRAGERRKDGKEWARATLHEMFTKECRLLQQEPGGNAILKRWEKAGRKLYEARLAQIESQRSISK